MISSPTVRPTTRTYQVSAEMRMPGRSVPAATHGQADSQMAAATAAMAIQGGADRNRAELDSPMISASPAATISRISGARMEK